MTFLKSTDKLSIGGRVRASLILKEAARRVEAGEKIELPQPALLRSLVWTMVDAVQGDGRFWHGIKTLAAWSDLPTRTAQRCLAVLVALEIVKADSRVKTRGHSRSDCTTVLVLDWDELERYCVPKETGARAAPVRGREPEAPLFGNTRQPGARSGANVRQKEAERAPNDPRTCANSSPASIDEGESSSDKPVLNQLRTGTPQPPDGGAGAAEREQTTADWTVAKAIVAAYPPTNGDLEGSDTGAAVKAIALEREAGSGITGELILAAAKSLAKNPPRSPVWCRNWLSARGYAKSCEGQLRVQRAGRFALVRTMRSKADREAERQTARLAEMRVEAALAGLSDADLERLKVQVIASAPSISAVGWMHRADPRTSVMLRELMVAHQESDRSVTAGGFAVGSGAQLING